MEDDDIPWCVRNSHLEVFLLAFNHARRDISSLAVESIYDMEAGSRLSLASLKHLQTLKLDLSTSHMDFIMSEGEEDFPLCGWFRSVTSLKKLTLVQGKVRTSGYARLRGVDFFEILKVNMFKFPALESLYLESVISDSYSLFIVVSQGL